MDEINATELSYTIKRITNNDIPTVINCLKKSFFLDEPLNESMRLCEENESVIKLEDFCKTYLRTGLSFMAVSPNDEVIGAILNHIMCKDDTTLDEVEKHNAILKFDNIINILDKAQREVNLFGQYPNVNRIMDMKIITVNKEYRRQGVCKALINKTKELALESECQMIYVDCSSHFTAKTAQRLGFKCIYSLCYSDYVNEQGEVVFKTSPPHKYFQAYVLPL